MKVRTATNPIKILPVYKTEEYEPGVIFCYATEKDGITKLLAIIHNVNGEFVVDAEADVLALIPSASPTTIEPHPLYNIYVRAYGKIAKHIGVEVIGDFYFGHKVLNFEPSKMTWEQLRKLEYQIVPSSLDPELDSELDSKLDLIAHKN